MITKQCLLFCVRYYHTGRDNDLNTKKWLLWRWTKLRWWSATECCLHIMHIKYNGGCVYVLVGTHCTRIYRKYPFNSERNIAEADTAAAACPAAATTRMSGREKQKDATNCQNVCHSSCVVVVVVVWWFCVRCGRHRARPTHQNCARDENCINGKCTSDAMMTEENASLRKCQNDATLNTRARRITYKYIII